jgi:hypothetical protein
MPPPLIQQTPPRRSLCAPSHHLPLLLLRLTLTVLCVLLLLLPQPLQPLLRLLRRGVPESRLRLWPPFRQAAAPLPLPLALLLQLLRPPSPCQ